MSNLICYSDSLPKSQNIFPVMFSAYTVIRNSQFQHTAMYTVKLYRYVAGKINVFIYTQLYACTQSLDTRDCNTQPIALVTN